MDKKLLLAIQSVCNSDGIRLPWDKVGELMGDRITDGAVIQHLAKIRQRMVSQGLDVPPPLRRGGGSIISTTRSGSATVNRQSVSKKAKPKKGSESLSTIDENVEDDEDFSVKESDSGEEISYAQARRRSRKSVAKNRDKAIKNEDSEEDETDSSYQIGGKRKRKWDATLALKDSREKTKNPRVDSRKKVKPNTLIKTKSNLHAQGCSFSMDVGNTVDDQPDPEATENDESELAQKQNQYLAAGADFLELDESEMTSQSEVQTDNIPFSRGTNVTVFRFKNSERAKNILRQLEAADKTENGGNVSEYTSDSNESDENQASEQIESTDVDVDSENDTTEPIEAEGSDRVYRNANFPLSVGPPCSNSHGYRHTSRPRIPHDALGEDIHTMYHESTKRDCHLMEAAKTNQNRNFEYVVSSDTQTAQKGLSNNLMRPPRSSQSWGSQPQFDQNYVPMANQYPGVHPEIYGAPNHQIDDHVVSESLHSSTDLASNHVLSFVPTEMSRSSSYRVEMPQQADQVPSALSGCGNGCNTQSHSNQHECLLGTRQSPAPPLPVHVPQQAIDPVEPIDSYSLTATNPDSPPQVPAFLIEEYGDIFSAQETMEDPDAPQNIGVQFSDFLVPMDDFGNITDPHFDNRAD